MPSRLVNHLVVRGLLSPEQADAVIRRQATMGSGSMDTAVLELRLLPESTLLAELGETSGFRPVNLVDFEPNPEVAPLIPGKIAERLGVVPLSIDGNTLHLASSDPVPKRDLEEVALLLGKSLEIWVAIEMRVRDWLASVYGVTLPPRFATLIAAHEQPVEAPLDDAPSPPPAEETVIDLVQRKPAHPLGDALPAPLPLVHAVPSAQAASPARPSVSTVRVEPHGYAAYAREATANEEPQRRTVTEIPLARGELDLPTLPGRPAFAGPVETPRRRTEPEFRASSLPPRDAQFLVFPNPGSREAVTTPRAAVTRPVEGPPVEWTLAQARAALKEASRDRDRLLDVALRFARRTFDFAAAFAVMRGAAVGFSARGEGAEQANIAEVNIPLDAASVFRTVALTRGSYVGPLPPDALSLRYLQNFGRAPRTVFLFPVEVKSRLVAVLYGDSGAKPISQRRLSDLLLFCQDLPSAFQELFQYRKQQSDLKLPVLDIPEPVATPAPSASFGWSAFSSSSGSSLGRAASMPAFVPADADRPPPDFNSVLRRLTGPDAALRAHAMAELARSPEISARVLTQNFPGPTGWSRLPVADLPEADELGPIPGALSRLGRAGAQALSPLLDSDDGETRYFALLTAGNLPYAELVSGILRGLFDYEPDISSAARAAATAFKRLPRFDAAMRDLRQELASHDSLRRSLAARALGTLHDRGSVDGLIGLTASDDPMCAQAAADALREITRATFGVDTRAWTRWWAENRTRHRAAWLVAALRHPDLDLRLAASEELTRVLSDVLGYRADAPATERETAVRRWEAVLADPTRNRRLAVL